MGAHQDALRQRMKYTGESWRALCNTSIDHVASIPDAADAAQRDLEAAVFEALNLGNYFPHAYGVERIRIRPDGTIAVHLDSVTEDGRCQLAPLLLRKLLPYTDDEGELHGEPGIRVYDANGSSLVLTAVGGSAKVNLLVGGGDWQADLDAFALHVGESGGQIDWDTEGYTAAERPWLPPESSAPLKAMGSGLLRRVVAFQQIGQAHALSAWPNEFTRPKPGTVAGRWNVEVVRDHTAEPGHDPLVAAMSARFHGLPLRETSRWCACTSTEDGAPVFGRYCTITLTTLDRDYPVELQLRFVDYDWPDSEVVSATELGIRAGQVRGFRPPR